MEAKEIARDTVYATIGFASLTAQTVQEQARKSTDNIQSILNDRDELHKSLSVARDRVSSGMDTVQSQVERVVEQAKGTVEPLRRQAIDAAEPITKQAESARSAIETKIPTTMRTGIDQVIDQVAAVADQVKLSARRFTPRAA